MEKDKINRILNGKEKIKKAINDLLVYNTIRGKEKEL